MFRLSPTTTPRDPAEASEVMEWEESDTKQISGGGQRRGDFIDSIHAALSFAYTKHQAARNYPEEARCIGWGEIDAATVSGGAAGTGAQPLCHQHQICVCYSKRL